MSNSKQNPSRPAQMVIVIVCGNVNKKENEPLPSWEDVAELEKSMDQPLSVSWPHRRIRKTRAYKKWQRYASVLRRYVLYLKSGAPIFSGMAAMLDEVKRQEERARNKLLTKVPPRKRGC